MTIGETIAFVIYAIMFMVLIALAINDKGRRPPK